MPIPNIIHHIWFNFTPSKKGYKMPYKYSKDRKITMRMNPEYKFLLWDKLKAKTLVKTKYSWFYPTYKKLSNIEKVDSFKYVLMYEYGGIYLDVDIRVIKPFNTFFSKFYKNHKNKKIILSEEGVPIINLFTLSNAFFASEIKLPFWINILKYIMNWGLSPLSYLDCHLEILEKTGPIMMSLLYNDYVYKNTVIIVPNMYFIEENKDGFCYHYSSKTWCNYYELLYSIFKLIVIIYIVHVIVSYI